MKALIVEDELLARIGMRSLIDWKDLGIILLEDAQDGNEALKRIEEERPDLVLLDLNIPGISGLELLKIIKNRRISTKVVVVSCYDDFDTVKEAMRLGAVDYIRKFGLSKEELTATLSNITEMTMTVEPIHKSVAQSGYEIRERIQNIPEEFQSGYCLSFYMLWKYSEEITDMKILETIACQYYQSQGHHLMSLSYEGKILILMQEKTDLEDVNNLKKMIAPFVTNRYYIGITEYEGAEKNPQLFVQLARTIETLGFYGAKEDILFFERPVEVQESYPFDISGYTEKLDKGLQKISEADIMEALNGLFKEITDCHYLSVDLVKKLMIEILSRFSDKASQLGGAIEEIEVCDSCRHYQKIIYITNFNDMYQWWTEFVKLFVNQFFTRQKRSESDIIQSALDYIEENISRSIQLSDAARYIGVSEPYLSSFFKSTMKENFIPYVNRMKVKRAKQLLSEGKMVYQVSELLGFENSTYFTKVFKKIEGVTPEQYRKKI